ncbi:MAG: hypothetical protein LH649_01840 [Pseudanabaena sp. CAN_BIN31]|nr:hypothetical protein [Pseudanabaena sp. CAN_BIN31]
MLQLLRFNIDERLLPETFPVEVSQPIFDGMISLAKRSLDNYSQWVYKP